MNFRHILTCGLLSNLFFHLLVDRSVAVVLEGDGEGDDGDGNAPTADEVAQVADHAAAPGGLGDHGVHVDALHEVEGEGGRVEEVDADAHVAALPVHHQHVYRLGEFRLIREWDVLTFQDGNVTM